jgi:hypothetical protein
MTDFLISIFDFFKKKNFEKFKRFKIYLGNFEGLIKA